MGIANSRSSLLWFFGQVKSDQDDFELSSCSIRTADAKNLVTQIGLSACAHALARPNCPLKLFSIELPDVTKIDDRCMTLFAQVFRASQRLESFSLYGAHFTGSIAVWAPALAINTTLTTLCLKPSIFHSTFWKDLQLPINLRIFQCDIHSLSAVARLLPSHADLVELSFTSQRSNGFWSGWRTSDTAPPAKDVCLSVAHLANALRAHSGVRVLQLNDCLDDDGATFLADALRNNTTVTELTICDNWIGNAGALALAEMLKVNSSITELNCGRNIWSAGVGMAGILLALSHNRSLETISSEQSMIVEPRGYGRFLYDALPATSSDSPMVTALSHLLITNFTITRVDLSYFERVPVLARDALVLFSLIACFEIIASVSLVMQVSDCYDTHGTIVYQTSSFPHHEWFAPQMVMN